MNERLLVLNPAAFNWGMITPVLPELILLAIGVALVAIDLFAPRQRQLLPWLTVLGVSAVLLMNLGMSVPAEAGMMLLNDGYAAYFCSLCLASVILTALMREMYSEQIGAHQGEFYSLMVFSAVGMMVMVASVDLMTIYLGLELMALPLYVLIGMHKKEQRTSEAAAKYFLMGVFASALLLFGMSLLFGLTGSTTLASIGAYVKTHGLAGNPALILALGLMIAGLSFKVAVVPFHMWTPDVYQGSPSVLTAFMSVGPQGGGICHLWPHHAGCFSGTATQLGPGSGLAGSADHGSGQYCRPGANQSQAHAGLLSHCPRGLRPAGHCCRNGEWHGRSNELSLYLSLYEYGGIRHPHSLLWRQRGG